MSEYAPSLDGIDMPKSVRDLPVDPVRRFPVPWFVAWVDGKPEFRAADGRKWSEAVRMKLCWVCGKSLRVLPGSGGSHPRRVAYEQAFVIGPMCSVNRVTVEPPCHPECALFSAKACPFLARPQMARREGGGVMEQTVNPGGVMIRRNPGTTCLWHTGFYQVEGDGRGGHVLRLGEPYRVDWFCQGRIATRAEVVESIGSGVCHLFPDGPPDAETQAEFDRLRAAAEKYLPPLEVPPLPVQPVAGV